MSRPSNISFLRGHPSDNLLPSEEILQAYTTVLSSTRSTDEDENTRHPLTYGTDNGAYSVRQEIAKWVNKRNMNPNTECKAEHIYVTNGASYGAGTALLQCCPPEYTKLAFAVSPTYFLINKIFTDHGFSGRMRAVCETENGIDLVSLENQLQLHSTDKEGRCKFKFRYVLYLVPNYSNPGGYNLTSNEMRNLLKLARKYDILLLCDHVYDYLNYFDEECKPIETLVALDRASLPMGSYGNVVANYSFSKYFGPGLRVGWQEAATPELAFHLSQSGSAKSGGCPSQLNSFIAAEIIRSGTSEKILKRLNVEFGKRATAYSDALKKWLPSGTKVLGGKGGYFFWVILPDGYDVPSITERCAELGIKLAPGNYFEVEGDEQGWGESCFRVSLSLHPSEVAIPAIQIWGAVCENYKMR